MSPAFFNITLVNRWKPSHFFTHTVVVEVPWTDVNMTARSMVEKAVAFLKCRPRDLCIASASPPSKDPTQ